jgi:proliferating cell nuclear antigen
MFVAKLKEGLHLKKLVESIKELVTDINLEISSNGISLQAMDSSHVALVTLNLSYEGFEEYRCDKGMTIGVNITHLSKIMKCGGNEDSIILSADDEPSLLNITFENRKHKKISDFHLSLIDIDTEHLGIPDTMYSSVITMNSGEFTRICRELYALSETVTIETNKNYAKFLVSGEVVNGSITIEGDDDNETLINVEESVNLAFALRYLNMFTKASSLSDKVCMIVNF